MKKIMNWRMASLCLSLSSSLYAMEGQQDISPIVESSSQGSLALSPQKDFFCDVSKNTQLLIEKVLNSLNEETVHEIQRRRPKFIKEIAAYKNKVSKRIEKSFQDLFQGTFSDSSWQREVTNTLSKLAFIMFFEELNSNISSRKVGIPSYDFFESAPLPRKNLNHLKLILESRYSWDDYQKTSSMLLQMLSSKPDEAKSSMVKNIDYTFQLISTTVGLHLNLMCDEKKHSFFTQDYRTSILNLKKKMGELFFSFPEIIKQVEERENEYRKQNPPVEEASTPLMHSTPAGSLFFSSMPQTNNGMSTLPPFIKASIPSQPIHPVPFYPYMAPQGWGHNSQQLVPGQNLLGRPLTSQVDLDQLDRHNLNLFLGCRKQELADAKQIFAQMDQKMDDLSSLDKEPMDTIQSLYQLMSNFSIANTDNPHLLSHLSQKVEWILGFIDRKVITLDKTRVEEYILRFSGIKNYILERVDENSVVYKRKKSRPPLSRGTPYNFNPNQRGF